VICEIDNDYIKRHGKSLVSPVVITSKHQFRLLEDKENILEVIQLILKKKLYMKYILNHLKIVIMMGLVI